MVPGHAGSACARSADTTILVKVTSEIEMAVAYDPLAASLSLHLIGLSDGASSRLGTARPSFAHPPSQTETMGQNAPEADEGLPPPLVRLSLSMQVLAHKKQPPPLGLP